MTSSFQRAAPRIESTPLSEEEERFLKASLWRIGATPEITNQQQYAKYKRLATKLARKYDAETRRSLSFIRSHDGVLLTSVEARLAEWEQRSQG